MKDCEMKIWFRVGVDICISEDEYKILKSKDLSQEFKETFFKSLLKRGELRGESYAPKLEDIDIDYVNEREDYKEISFEP